jgi:hypothetical protein
VRDEVASSVGENASTRTSTEVKVEHARPKDEAGSIGESARVNDEGESKSTREWKSNMGKGETNGSTRGVSRTQN